MSEDRLSLLDEEGNHPDPSAGKESRKRSRRVLFGVVGVLVVALIAAAAVVGYYGKAAFDALDSINRDPSMMPTGVRPSAVPTAAGQDHAPINFVLMGSDTRGNERGRSDVLQILHLPGSRDAAYLMSIPRDSWVDIPGRSTAKINAAYSWGGPALTVQTVEQLLDVPMDHTVIIDFEGFVNVIDTLGGITVTNRHESTSRGFHFDKGEISLTGEAALIFVRERYDLPSGDFDRAERQRDVIQAVVKKLASAGTLADPGKFRDAVTTLGPNFTVDSGLTNDVIIDLAMNSQEALGNIRSMGFPNLGPGWSPDGKQSIVLLDDAKVAELAAAMRADTVGEYYEAQQAG